MVFSVYACFKICWSLMLYRLILLVVEIYKTYGKTEENNEVYRQADKVSSKISDCQIEALTNIRAIKCFSSENKETHRIEKLTKLRDDLYAKNHQQYKSDFFSMKNFYAMFVDYQLQNVLELWYIGINVASGTLNYGEYTAFVTTYCNISYGYNNLKYFYSDFNKALRVAKKYNEVMDYKPKVVSGDKKIQNLEAKIEFNNVEFAYPLKPEVTVIKNLDFKINRGEIVAFVGASGSGKSTLANLILRLYDTVKGDILIDGVSIKDLDLKWYHSKIGYVPQDSCLFSENIEYNIAYTENQYTQSDLDQASKKANAHSFIMDKSRFPEGYKTVLGSRGMNISGGQKQRIAIARALMKKFKILLLDEATSALDANSEFEVQKAIDSVIQGLNTTTIIIAHRLSTIKNCDRIFVMDKGSIMESGTHKELLEKDGFYKKLIDRQLEVEEKENGVPNSNTSNKDEKL